MRAVFLALAIALGLCGCRQRKVLPPPPPPPPSSSLPADTLLAGTVIQGVGTWNHYPGTTLAIHNLSVNASAKRVEWRTYSRPLPGRRGQSSGTIELSSPAAPWFIYVEATDRLWFFDGAGHLSLRAWAVTGIETSEAILDGVLQEGSQPVPHEIVPLLPAGLQKLFPAAASKPRPSI